MVRYGKSLTEALWIAGLGLMGYDIVVDEAMPDRVMSINDAKRIVKMNQAQLDRIQKILAS